MKRERERERGGGGGLKGSAHFALQILVNISGVTGMRMLTFFKASLKAKG